jgi:ADP-ribosylglycohydrolase
MFNVVYDSKNDLCGDEGDDQFPAIVKFPPIVALYHDKENFSNIVDVVTRLTNNNDRSVSYGRVYAAMLAAAIRTGDKDAVIEAAKESANPEIREIIDAALARIDEPNVDVTGYFGRSCHLPFGLPQNIHLISNCNSYVDAMRMNILAAGDNAGRGIMIGAIYAALYGVGGDQGVPQAWIDKVTIKQEIDELLSMVPSTPEPEV